MVNQNDLNNLIPTNNIPKPPSNKILWYMFFIAIFVYNIVAVFMSYDEKFGENGFIGTESGLYSMLFYALIIISFINFIVIFKLKAKSESKTPILNSSGKEINYTVVRIAFAESMAIFGLVLFLINGNFNHLMFFTALAIVGMFIVYPRK
jgi:hypothetical protein